MQDKDTVLSEVKDFSKILIIINKVGLATLLIVVPTVFVIGYVSGMELPLGLLISSVVFGITVFIFLYLLNRGIKTLEDFRKICMIYFSIMMIFLTILVHYLGGIEALGLTLYIFAIIEVSIILSPVRATMITLLAAVSYAIMALLEYYSIIPHYDLLVGQTFYNNLKFLLIMLIGGAFLGLSFISFIAGKFSHVYRKTSEILKQDRKKLLEARLEIEKTRDNLEVRVKARTEDLEKVTANLENQIKKRTKELQDKVEEMEKFQKFAIGREMKMVELKKKLEEVAGKNQKS